MEKQKYYPISQPSITEKEIEYVNIAMKSGWISSLGKYINEFETNFAKFCGTKYALTTSNGTTGLHLALSALKVGKGDEVIIPDLTFVATANAISYTGAVPVMVDVDPNTLCIDPKAISNAITKKTRAIMPVHLYGHPSDMDKINDIAKQYNLFVIEDAAEAIGSKYKGKVVGGLSDFGVFSFYGNKSMTTGEGGMLTTNSELLYNYAKYLRDHAMNQEKRYFHTEVGYNYRMTNIQAAMGVAQLERIDEILDHRVKLLLWYKNNINQSSTVRLNFEAEWAKNTNWLICLEIDGLDHSKKHTLMQRLKSKGIDTRPYFYPMSSMPMYKSEINPISYLKSNIGLNIPTYFDLTEEDVIYISTIINDELKKI